MADRGLRSIGMVGSGGTELAIDVARIAQLRILLPFMSLVCTDEAHSADTAHETTMTLLLFLLMHRVRV